MSISGEIENLERLHANGTLTDEEFEHAKQRVLSGDVTTNSSAPFGSSFGNSEEGKIHGVAEDTWCTLMHASQLMIFAGGVGILVPIIMWAISKDDSDLARRHGARMMNWLISSFIYGIVGAILLIVFIGLPILLVLLVLDVVFPIIAALKANDKTLWSYPMAIKFLQED